MYEAQRRTYRALIGNMEESGNIEDGGVSRMRILNCILNKSGGRAWTGVNWLRRGKSSWVISIG
jgi:hypothetical protein